MLSLDMLRDHNFLELVLDNISDGINIVDREGLVVYANRLSANYAGVKVEDMIGRSIEGFYPDAVLLNVIRTKRPQLDRKIHYVDDKIYIVSSYPVIIDAKLVGAFSVFRDIREVDQLNRTIRSLRLSQSLEDFNEDFDSLIGATGSLARTVEATKRAVGSIGGPKHCLIVGQEGTGKSTLARMIYDYGKKISTIGQEAPFIEFNPKQYSDPELASRELFGHGDGDLYESKGLVEAASDGILHIEEIEAMGPYQNMVLSLLDQGRYRKLGSILEHYSPATIIISTTDRGKDEILPDLYYRLYQHELSLPRLAHRPKGERRALFDYFVKSYRKTIQAYQDISFEISFDKEAVDFILDGDYPRNLSQFRDLIYNSIDRASPKIEDIDKSKALSVQLGLDHIAKPHRGTFDKEDIYPLIDQLSLEGLGPRKISARLASQGIDFKYYQVAYYLNKKKDKK